jgi:hypothetical protein
MKRSLHTLPDLFIDREHFKRWQAVHPEKSGNSLFPARVL